MPAAANDRIGQLLNAKKLVPSKFAGSSKYLDIVSWNIRYFDHTDPRRVGDITEVMDALNADIFVLTEIADDGVLQEVEQNLAKNKAGSYSVKYGSTGGQQRVALMWDRDWVRAKRMPEELFKDVKEVPAENGRRAEVFPRLPLWAYFEARSENPAADNFTFELMGVHLKSQMAPQGWKGERGQRFGTNQRRMAAEHIGHWMVDNGQHFDEDVLVIGDWNAETDEREWDPIRALEKSDGAQFTTINPKMPTHLARLNKSGPAGSRLDLHLITKAADANAVPDQKGIVIQWTFFDSLGSLDTPQRNALYKEMRLRISDHLPIVSRFYLTDAGE